MPACICISRNVLESMPMKDGTVTGKGLRVGGIILCLVTAVLLVTAGGLFYVRIYQVEPAFSEMTYEFGTPVSQDIQDYLVGTDWSVGLGELDLSRVDEDRTGTYQAVARHGSGQFSYIINIRDTAPPQIVWKDSQVYLALQRECSVEDVIEGVIDADASAKAYFFGEEGLSDHVYFDRLGEYELEILARDSSGNESSGRVTVIVDIPPVLDGIRDFYVALGSAPDYLDQVTAWDDIDGDLTDSIRVEDSEVFLDRAGEYTLTYLATDSYGLVTEEEAKVLVATEDELQELIGRRQIDYREDVILGAPNIYDAGVSRDEYLEETLEYMRPALVQLYHPTGRGGYSSGSGYIMEITEDTIFICTNRHVVSKYEDWDIYFFDGTSVPGECLGTSEDYDVGVATVALEDVPRALLRQLMTVHIDRLYWESLDEQPIELALERIDREGGLVHTTEGNLIKIRQDFEWYNQLDHTEVTVELVHGDSGSAVLDGYGNLICMAYAYSTTPTRYWCVPLDGILTCYEEITGRMPYVYGAELLPKLP